MFKLGEPIVCIDDSSSNGLLKKGSIYIVIDCGSMDKVTPKSLQGLFAKSWVSVLTAYGKKAIWADTRFESLKKIDEKDKISIDKKLPSMV